MNSEFIFLAKIFGENLQNSVTIWESAKGRGGENFDCLKKVEGVFVHYNVWLP